MRRFFRHDRSGNLYFRQRKKWNTQQTNISPRANMFWSNRKRNRSLMRLHGCICARAYSLSWDPVQCMHASLKFSINHKPNIHFRALILANMTFSTKTSHAKVMEHNIKMHFFLYCKHISRKCIFINVNASKRRKYARISILRLELLQMYSAMKPFNLKVEEHEKT